METTPTPGCNCSYCALAKNKPPNVPEEPTAPCGCLACALNKAFRELYPDECPPTKREESGELRQIRDMVKLYSEYYRSVKRIQATEERIKTTADKLESYKADHLAMLILKDDLITTIKKDSQKMFPPEVK